MSNSNLLSSHAQRKIIAPSILSADFSNLAREIELVTEAGAEFIHVDVMDGHFVPNLTIGMPVVKSIRPVTQKILDVHLMIEKPENYIEEFVKVGSDYLTLHVESTKKMSENLKLIRDLGAKAGITLKPGTPISVIEPYLRSVDLVLVMTVEPGFGGQSFMNSQVSKIEFLNSYRAQHGLSYLIEVDGGINAVTSKICWNAGADVLVAGSAIFQANQSQGVKPQDQQPDGYQAQGGHFTESQFVREKVLQNYQNRIRDLL